MDNEDIFKWQKASEDNFKRLEAAEDNFKWLEAAEDNFKWLEAAEDNFKRLKEFCCEPKNIFLEDTMPKTGQIIKDDLKYRQEALYHKYPLEIEKTIDNFEENIRRQNDLIKTVTPLRLKRETVNKMVLRDLELLLSGEHPQYLNRHLSPDTNTLVKLRIEDLKKEHLNNSLAEMITLTKASKQIAEESIQIAEESIQIAEETKQEIKEAKKPHWTGWIIFVAVIITTLITIWPFTRGFIESYFQATSQVPPIQQNASEAKHGVPK